MRKTGIGKTLSICTKIFALIFAVSAFFIHLVKNGQMPSADQATAIVMIAGFITSIFLPVDISKIINNAKGRE